LSEIFTRPAARPRVGLPRGVLAFQLPIILIMSTSDIFANALRINGLSRFQERLFP